MENIINVNALRDALDSGMSPATIISWVDDSIMAMVDFNKGFDRSYVAVSRYDLDKIKQRLSNIEDDYIQFNMKHR
jgi:hypothetical protein